MKFKQNTFFFKYVIADQRLLSKYSISLCSSFSIHLCHSLLLCLCLSASIHLNVAVVLQVLDQPEAIQFLNALAKLSIRPAQLVQVCTVLTNDQYVVVQHHISSDHSLSQVDQVQITKQKDILTLLVKCLTLSVFNHQY